ncbi:hypothetical protein FVE85_8134 [Porphyridium purpureum]|uniref:Transmembrane protein n=1 Tax=Porphyridium purpureum TaxID=35688 RepID=A0A5J4YQF9_PORPP|nr:hypothetical protein FVE85_8134 [Porphyridium purpureum]|eukprot:POR3857..scf295_9
MDWATRRSKHRAPKSSSSELGDESDARRNAQAQVSRVTGPPSGLMQAAAAGSVPSTSNHLSGGGRNANYSANAQAGMGGSTGKGFTAGVRSRKYGRLVLYIVLLMVLYQLTFNNLSHHVVPGGLRRASSTTNGSQSDALQSVGLKSKADARDSAEDAKLKLPLHRTSSFSNVSVGEPSHDQRTVTQKDSTLAREGPGTPNPIAAHELIDQQSNDSKEDQALAAAKASAALQFSFTEAAENLWSKLSFNSPELSTVFLDSLQRYFGCEGQQPDPRPGAFCPDNNRDTPTDELTKPLKNMVLDDLEDRLFSAFLYQAIEGNCMQSPSHEKSLFLAPNENAESQADEMDLFNPSYLAWCALTHVPKNVAMIHFIYLVEALQCRMCQEQTRRASASSNTTTTKVTNMESLPLDFVTSIEATRARLADLRVEREEFEDDVEEYDEDLIKLGDRVKDFRALHPEQSITDFRVPALFLQAKYGNCRQFAGPPESTWPLQGEEDQDEHLGSCSPYSKLMLRTAGRYCALKSEAGNEVHIPSAEASPQAPGITADAEPSLTLTLRLPSSLQLDSLRSSDKGVWTTWCILHGMSSSSAKMLLMILTESTPQRDLQDQS